MHKGLETLRADRIPQAAKTIIARRKNQRAVTGVGNRGDGVAVSCGNAVQPMAVPVTTLGHHTSQRAISARMGRKPAVPDTNRVVEGA